MWPYWLLRSALAVLLALAATAGSGQTATTPSASTGVWCPLPKDPGRPGLHLPDEEVKAMPSHGVVARVQMTFDAADAAPNVSLLYNSGSAAFGRAIVDSVKGYRLSCFEGAEAPWSGTQEFQFVPGNLPRLLEGRVRGLRAKDGVVADCVVGREGEPSLQNASRGAIVDGLGVRSEHPRSGFVIVKLRFEQADRGPEVTVLLSNAGADFERAVRDHVKAFRWACAGGAPLEVTQTFQLRMEPEASTSIQLTLPQLLAAVEGIEFHRVRFDFNSMQCPFDAAFEYFRPYTSNTVMVDSATAAQRAIFYDWLGTLVLKPSLNVRDRLIGTTFKVSVPCVVLDLSK